MRERGPDHTQWLRRVFGDVLPDSTADDRSEYEDKSPDERDRQDRWLRDNRPPHHGGPAEG